jgi:ribonuclease HI
MKTVDIYTDGACSCNPGPGGWAAILIYKGNEKPISGGQLNTTNNCMELLAAIQGLKALNQVCKVNLYSDSAYLVNAVNNGWLDAWRYSGWKTADKKPVKNRELWEELVSLLDKHQVTFIKVKGYADNAYNNRCDALARAEILKIS